MDRSSATALKYLNLFESARLGNKLTAEDQLFSRVIEKMLADWVTKNHNGWFSNFWSQIYEQTEAAEKVGAASKAAPHHEGFLKLLFKRENLKAPKNAKSTSHKAGKRSHKKSSVSEAQKSRTKFLNT